MRRLEAESISVILLGIILAIAWSGIVEASATDKLIAEAKKEAAARTLNKNKGAVDAQ